MESAAAGGFHRGFREAEELDRNTDVLPAGSLCPTGLRVGNPPAKRPPMEGPTGGAPPDELWEAPTFPDRSPLFVFGLSTTGALRSLT